MQLNRRLARTTCFVCEELDAPCLIGSTFTFIDQYVQAIDANSNDWNWWTLASSHSCETQPAPPRHSQMVLGPSSVDPERRSTKIRVARQTAILPESQCWVLVNAQWEGDATIEPVPGLVGRKGISTPNGIISFRKNLPTEILVANFSSKPVTAPKGMVIAMGAATASVISPTNVLIADV